MMRVLFAKMAVAIIGIYQGLSNKICAMQHTNKHDRLKNNGNLVLCCKILSTGMQRTNELFISTNDSWISGIT